ARVSVRVWWLWHSYRVNAPAHIPLYVAIPSLVDRTLCPAGHHVLTATTVYPDPPDGADAGWAEYKGRCEDAMLARLEALVPGLRSRIVVMESATRQTIHHYTLN